MIFGFNLKWRIWCAVPIIVLVICLGVGSGWTCVLVMNKGLSLRIISDKVLMGCSAGVPRILVIYFRCYRNWPKVL